MGGAEMKKLALLLGTLAVALVAYGVALRSYAQTKTNDEAEIKALEERFISAFMAKDVEAIMKGYAPGAELVVFDVVPPRQYVGFDAYKKDWEDFFALFPGRVVVFEIKDLSITTDNKLGYGHSIQHTIMTKKDGSKMDLTVRVTDCYSKISGKWLIAHEHVSVPVDLDTGKADLSSKP